MAEGKPVGTMYVELSMDSTKYTKAQKDILSGAEKNSADINKVFKTVGTQSDQMYDAMRKNITNALDAIKRSHLSSADEIRRAEESAAEKVRRIDVQQFGERKSLLDNLKSHWLATTAAITAAMVTIGQAWSLAKMGAEYDEQRGILDNLATAYDTTADEIVESMRRASEGMISNSNLMQVALGGLAKGLNPDQLINLADAAKILGDSVGVTATQALQDLTQALETGRTKGLKNYLGTSLDLKAVFGDLESKMTATEKAQALYNLTMISATELQKRQKKEVDESADNIDRIQASYDNAKLALGRWAKTAVASAFDFLVASKAVFSWDPKEYEKRLGDQIRAQKAAAEAAKGSSAAYEDMNAKLRAEIEQREKNKKSLEGHTATTQAHSRAVKELNNEQRAQNELLNWAAQARILNAKEANGWQYNPAETPTAPVKAEKDNFVEDTEAKAAAAARLTAQMKRQDQERALSSNNFFAGVRVGWEQMQEDQYTWAKGGQAMFEDFASSSRYVMSDVLFDGIKGDMDSFQDYWDSFFDSMLRTLTDTVSQMAVQWGINAAASAGSSWGWWDSGLWEAAKDHPAIIHKGEMVVPADIAAKVRGETGSRGMNELSAVSPSGGHEWGSMEDNRTLNAMAQGTMRSWALNTAQGVSLYARGAIPTEAFMAGLFNPTRLVSAGIAGGIPAGVRDYMGLDATNSWANWGQTIGGVLAAFATGYAGPAGVAAVGTGASLGAVIGDAIGDAFGGRNYESTRDAFEAAYGYTEGRQKFADLVEGITALEKELGLVAGIDYDAMTAFGSRGDAGGRGIARDIDRDMGGAGAIGGERESRDYGGMAKTGVDYIPRDNITYTTHEGEAILTKEQARAWRSGRGGSGGGMVIEDLRIYIGDEEVTSRVKVVADGVIVERNRAGVNPTSRVYN